LSERVLDVSTSPVKILDINPKRIEWIIQNQGATDVYIGKSKEVSTSGTRTGRKLEAGAIDKVSRESFPVLIQHEQWAVVVTGSTTLWLWEATKEALKRLKG